MRITIIVSIISFLLISCTDNNVSGGGIDVANGYVSGIIQTTSSSTDDSIIIVKLIPKSFNPISEIMAESLIDTTDHLGNFSIGPVDSGKYNIMARTINNSYIGFIGNITFNDSDLFITDTIDKAYTISLILHDSIYGTSNNLFIEGTDINVTIPDSMDTLILVLPKDTLPSLLISNIATISIDTIINELPLIDSLIDLSAGNNQYDTTGQFIHWSNLGIGTDTVTELIMDSSYNIWAMSNSAITCLLTDSTGELINATYYIKDVFSDSINQLTCVAISPIGEMWIGTDGMGMYRRIISSTGILTGGASIKSEVNIYMLSDTVSAIDFKDSTILVTSPGGANYGNYYLNDQSNSVESNMGEIFASSYFFGTEDFLYIVDSTLEKFNMIDSTITTSPLGYLINSDKIIEIRNINRDLFHIFYKVPSSSGRKITIFNNTTQQLKEYSFPGLDPNSFVTSSIIDYDGNEWFGFSNGSLIKVIDGDEMNYKIYNSENSNLLNDGDHVNALIITTYNRLYATVGVKGFFELNLNPIN